MSADSTSSTSRRTRDVVAGRLIMHFWWFVVAVVLTTLLLQFLNNPLDTMAQHSERMRWTLGPLVMVALAMSPMLIWDSIKLSKRLVEPVERVEERLHSFAREGKALEIPEDGDSLWRGLEAECNAALRSADGLRLDSAKKKGAAVPSPSSPAPNSGRSRRLRPNA